MKIATKWTDLPGECKQGVKRQLAGRVLLYSAVPLVFFFPLLACQFAIAGIALLDSSKTAVIRALLASHARREGQLQQMSETVLLLSAAHTLGDHGEQP